jgi:hypothetical protein
MNIKKFHVPYPDRIPNFRQVTGECLPDQKSKQAYFSMAWSAYDRLWALPACLCLPYVFFDFACLDCLPWSVYFCAY